jgi:hypothetical protein
MFALPPPERGQGLALAFARWLGFGTLRFECWTRSTGRQTWPTTSRSWTQWNHPLFTNLVCWGTWLAYLTMPALP